MSAHDSRNPLRGRQPAGEPMSTLHPTATVSLNGHLTAEVLAEALSDAERALAQVEPKIRLLVDCLNMADYDRDARQAFVNWNRKHQARIAAVAVVTHRQIWHVVVGAMALASGQKMRAFDTIEAARAWLVRRVDTSAYG